jgi:small subunit ribosomal protein S8
MTDPIADLLTRIRNAEMANHLKVSIPHSKEKESILNVLKKYKYISDYKIEEKKFKNIIVDLEEDKKSKTFYKRISTPGQRMYIKSTDIKPIKSGLGISIISTSKGIMSNIEAKKSKLGGELLCEIW